MDQIIFPLTLQHFYMKWDERLISSILSHRFVFAAMGWIIYFADGFYVFLNRLVEKLDVNSFISNNYLQFQIIFFKYST